MGPMPGPGAGGHVAHLLLLNAKALLVEVALQLFIAEVDAQLLKRVGLQNLKPKDILSQKKKRPGFSLVRDFASCVSSEDKWGGRHAPGRRSGGAPSLRPGHGGQGRY